MMKICTVVLLVTGYGFCIGWNIVMLVTGHGWLTIVGLFGAVALFVWEVVRYRRLLWRNR